jgi:hypothetical protein
MANPPIFEDIATPLIDPPSPFTLSESVVPLFPDQSDASSLGEQASQAVTIDDLPKIRIRGEDYVDQSLLYSKTPRRSWIYNHGMGLVNVKTNKIYWNCGICGHNRPKAMFAAKATSAAAAHLTREHRLREFNDTPDQELPHGRQGSVLD